VPHPLSLFALQVDTTHAVADLEFLTHHSCRGGTSNSAKTLNDGNILLKIYMEFAYSESIALARF
jgi:hypothetical protein